MKTEYEALIGRLDAASQRLAQVFDQTITFTDLCQDRENSIEAEDTEDYWSCMIRSAKGYARQIAEQHGLSIEKVIRERR